MTSPIPDRVRTHFDRGLGTAMGSLCRFGTHHGSHGRRRSRWVLDSLCRSRLRRMRNVRT